MFFTGFTRKILPCVLPRSTDNRAICSPRLRPPPPSPCKSPSLSLSLSLSIPSPDLQSHCVDLKQDVSRRAAAGAAPLCSAAENEKQKSFVGLLKGRESRDGRAFLMLLFGASEVYSTEQDRTKRKKIIRLGEMSMPMNTLGPVDRKPEIFTKPNRHYQTLGII